MFVFKVFANIVRFAGPGLIQAHMINAVNEDQVTPHKPNINLENDMIS